MSSFQATELHVSPARRQVADTDRTAFVFSAGEAITGATATLERTSTTTDESDLIESTTPDLGANTATVVVAGLARGGTYLLAVTFTRADTTSWTRLLTIQCVV